MVLETISGNNIYLMLNTIEIAALNKNCIIANKFQQNENKVQNCDDATFMDFIKEFPCIFDRSSKHFRDRNIQAKVRKKVSEILHTTNITETTRKHENIILFFFLFFLFITIKFWHPNCYIKASLKNMSL